MNEMKGDWRIVSHIPGRLRVRVHPKKTPELMDQVKNLIKDQPGIQEIDINTMTGSVLIRYDKKTRSSHEVVSMLHDIGVILYDVVAEGGGDLPEIGHSTTATQITNTISDLDQRIFHLSGGRANLKLLVPLAMGALGVRQILRKGWGLSQIPGYVLIWYAFDAFYKFHQNPQKYTDVDQ